MTTLGVTPAGVEQAQSDWQPKLASLIAAKGGHMAPAEFQRLVNVVFHDVEATVYDRVHDEMWKSLAPVLNRLADDAAAGVGAAEGLVLADIGCGTGLATTLLLESSLGKKIERLELGDTSSEMLSRCDWRAAGYLREVNRRLIRAGAIRRPMTSSEIWSVTDIHVDGLPYAVGDGISRDSLQRGLPGFANVSWRTYSFFGEMPSRLPASFAERERHLFQGGDPSGATVAGVWTRPW